MSRTNAFSWLAGLFVLASACSRSSARLGPEAGVEALPAARDVGFDSDGGVEVPPDVAVDPDGGAETLPDVGLEPDGGAEALSAGRDGALDASEETREEDAAGDAPDDEGQNADSDRSDDADQATCQQVSFAAETPSALAWQEQMAARILASPDCATSSAPECAVVSKTLDRGAPWCASVGRRSLHLDGFGYGDFERMHGRILSYLDRDELGNYAEWAPRVKIPEGRFAIEQALGDVAFPLNGLQSSLSLLARKYSYEAPRQHGDSFVASLVPRAPHAQFVLASFPGVNCDAELARQMLRRQVETLTKWIVQYGVRYIVMSGGVTRDSLSTCSGDGDSLLRVVRDELFIPMAAIPQTLFIQSAPNPEETVRDLRPNDPDFLVDCTPIPGRLRVSFAPIPKREVPPEGLAYQDFAASLPEGIRRTAACVDMFVPLFDQSEDMVVTSAAPASVLAMAIALENAVPGRLDGTGAERASALAGKGAPRLYDPVSNHQYESY